VKAQTQIASVEGPQRVVQEVVAIEPKLYLLGLLDLEVLEQAHIPVEKCRPVDRGENGGAVQADGRGHGETIGIDELVRREALPRIARQYRVELNVVRAEE